MACAKEQIVVIVSFVSPLRFQKPGRKFDFHRAAGWEMRGQLVLNAKLEAVAQCGCSLLQGTLWDCRYNVHIKIWTLSSAPFREEDISGPIIKRKLGTRLWVSFEAAKATDWEGLKITS